MGFTILQKHILKSFLPFFGLSVLVFTSLMIIVNLVQFVGMGILSGFSAYFLFKAVFYALPNILSIILPIAFLMALLLTLSELTNDGEIVAMRAGGYSFNEILAPVLAFSLLLFLFLVYSNNWLGPLSFKKSNQYIAAMAKKITKIELRPKTFQKILDWNIYSEKVDGKRKKMEKVRLSRNFENERGETSWILRVNAEKADYRIIRERGILVELVDGNFSRENFKRNLRMIYGRFDSYSIFMPFFTGGPPDKEPHRYEMSTPRLMGRLKRGIMDEGTEFKYKIEALSRNTLVFTPLIFFIIGAPLGLLLEKKGKAQSFSLSLFVIFAYYGLFTMSKIAVKSRQDLFPWAMFAPTVLGFAAGFYIWKKKLYLK